MERDRGKLADTEKISALEVRIPLGVIAIVLGFYPQAILGVVNNGLHALIQNLRPL